MELVLLGMAAPAAAATAGDLVDRTLHAATEPFAALLQSVASVLAQEVADPAALSGKMHGSLQTLSKELAVRIQNTLTSAGIDLSEPIEIRPSPVNGHLEVVGDHPQKALMEAALADDPELADMFTVVARLQRLRSAGEELNDPTAPEQVGLGVAPDVVVTALFTMYDNSVTLEFN